MKKKVGIPKPHKEVYQPIGRGGIEVEELPYPYVHYPSHYGTFIYFSKNSDGTQYLCECSIPAIINFLELRKRIINEPKSYLSYDNNNLKLFDKRFLPIDFQGQIDTTFNDLHFMKSVCHRCNFTPPKVRYCHEMYGSVFVQHFGWYINQTYLRFGIFRDYFLEDITPIEFIDDINLINQTKLEYLNEKKWFDDRDELTRQRIFDKQRSLKKEEINYEEIWEHQNKLRDKTKKYRQARRILSNKIEDIVREEFGYKKIGEQWTNETLLFQIIQILFSNHKLIRHFRPDWLNKLEIDIYIPDLNLGFEYQGQQHFHPVEIWGGQESLEKLQKRDVLKKAYCLEQKVCLLTIDYTEPLTVEYIKSKIPINLLG